MSEAYAVSSKIRHSMSSRHLLSLVRGCKRGVTAVVFQTMSLLFVVAETVVQKIILALAQTVRSLTVTAFLVIKPCQRSLIVTDFEP